MASEHKPTGGRKLALHNAPGTHELELEVSTSTDRTAVPQIATWTALRRIVKQ